jgi:hypothetical protein
MPQTDDWRLQGQHWLRDELLRYRNYSPLRPGFEHDHCEFCWTRFRTDAPRASESAMPTALGSREGVRAEGYVTMDRRWICEPCYEDFKMMFDWQLET